MPLYNNSGPNVSGNLTPHTFPIAGTGNSLADSLLKRDGDSLLWNDEEVLVDSVATADLDDDAVTRAKIAAGAVGSTELADEAVTLAKHADIPTGSVIGRTTAGTGTPEVLDIGTTLKTALAVTPEDIGITRDGASDSQQINIGADWDDIAAGAQNIIIGGGFGEFPNRITGANGLNFIFAGYNNAHGGGIASGFVGHHHGIMYSGVDHAFSAGGSYHVIGNASAPATVVSYPTVLGGTQLTVSATRGTALGGQSVTVSGLNSAGVGCDTTTLSGQYVFAGGALRCTSSGSYTQVFGADNTASADYSSVRGRYGVARIEGAQALGHGRFTAAGDRQSYTVPLQQTTTSAAAARMGGAVSGSTLNMPVPSGTVMSMRAHVVGVEPATGDAASYMVTALIKNIGGTTALVGSSATTVIGEDQAAWNAYFEADNTNDVVALRVVGEAAKTIRWTALVEVVELQTGA